MERVMSELANYFVLHGNLAIHLIMYGKSPSRFYSLHPNIILHVPKERFNDSLKTLYTLKRLAYLRKSVKEIQPDVLLSFGEIWNNFVLIALIGNKTPIFVSDRCKPDKSLGRVQNTLRKWLYPNSAGIIVQTKKAKVIYEQYFSEHKIKVIGNPIRKIENTQTEIKGKAILIVSRIVHTKHHDRLISIFAKLNAPDWKLIIVGGEAQKQKHVARLKKASEQLNVSDRVSFEGERKNVETYYLHSSIFAFTSSSEGFPNVIGEALSAGLPVVSYDCLAGPSEMIRDGENGFLIPQFDDVLFQEKLQQLIDDENLRKRLGKNAKTSISKFSVENIGNKYLDLMLPS
jgi:GalNAc-alpha-(1->4)-GalNAc-alpha-(1->3)-diNAcBac-PP-undecaprenol alpha-1,4-N-acetyl-D-galactosaminyltransferase